MIKELYFKNFFYGFIIILMLCLASNKVFANDFYPQDYNGGNNLVGITINIGVPTKNNAPIPVPNVKNHLTNINDSSMSYEFGLSYLHFLNSYEASGSAIQFGINYNDFSGAYKNSVIGTLPILFNETKEETAVYYCQEYNIQYLSFSMLYKYFFPLFPPKSYSYSNRNNDNITFLLSLGGGFDLGYIISNNITAKEKLDIPYTYIYDSLNVVRYEDGDKTAVLYDSKINNLNRIIPGVKAEIGFDIEIYRVFFSLNVGYNYCFNNIVTDSGWKISKLYFTFDLYFRLNM